MSLFISTTACRRHAELVAAALRPDAPLSLMERYVAEADDCPDCQRALQAEASGLLPDTDEPRLAPPGTAPSGRRRALPEQREYQPEDPAQVSEDAVEEPTMEEFP